MFGMKGKGGNCSMISLWFQFTWKPHTVRPTDVVRLVVNGPFDGPFSRRISDLGYVWNRDSCRIRCWQNGQLRRRGSGGNKNVLDPRLPDGKMDYGSATLRQSSRPEERKLCVFRRALDAVEKSAKLKNLLLWLFSSVGAAGQATWV